ncbi:complement C2 [Cheilinus undulatus]|uniref:complement C2 n=1 Tax=Cheilinus undulatus TaxID=241271 RepID=UPI001BD2196C|nr:complement C2 [Cheilinus undulatus]
MLRFIMYVKPAVWISLIFSIQEVFLQEYGDDYYEAYDDPEPLNCSTTETIRGGHVTYSQGGLEGSMLTYHCGLGQYPFPVSSRICSDGDWSTMRLPSGRQVSRAICKDMMCPAQIQLDHGDFWPRDQWLHVGATQSFSCHEGFMLFGSVKRNCTISGEWTGTTPICLNNDAPDDCDDPGVPSGAQRTSGRFYRGDKVIYTCQAGLDLLGSAEQVCLENREWSGSTPRCQAPYTFDSPSIVAEAMTGSLAGLMDVVSPDAKQKGVRRGFGRTFHVAKGSRMNVFILLDTSGSIKEEEFGKSRDATVALLRKLDSYEVQIKFHVLSFASEAKDIVNITDSDISGDIDNVIWNLMNFEYKSHGKKTGTNLHAALQRVYEMLGFLKRNSATNHFNETQNIIIIETDGFTNTGSKPQNDLAKIRSLLGYHDRTPDHTLETMLDVYVFGIGSDVKRDQLNSLASKKRGEEHVFVLKDYETLGAVFNSIISDKSVTMCGVAQEDTSEKQDGDEKGVYTRPWHVTLRTSSPCVGSIVSQNWVLTAAHCFARASTDFQQGYIQYGQADGTVAPKRVIIHPKYNTGALKHRNVSEFYDYDVALVEVNTSIPLSWMARPICLPCTVPASRALKKVNSTCQQHRQELLPHPETAASFIHKGSKRKITYIQTGGQRPSCVEKARGTLKEPTNVTMDEYVPDRFLCTGGPKHKYTVTCKGDSGGSLFLEKRKRYFQVGLVSWGTADVCSNTDTRMRGYTPDNPHPDARDFHIDLFKIAPWLKEHLGKEIQFLPDVK